MDQRGRDSEALEEMQRFELCVVAVDTSHPRTWATKGCTHINLFGGWLHEAVTTPLAEPTPGVQLWLDHIKTVFADANDTVYAFLLRWFARIAQRGKNEIGLDLKSVQGTGKSMVFEFLSRYVFGCHAVHITDDADVVTGDFNSSLAGKALLVLEEMPTAKDQYLSLSNKLKLICTGHSLTVKKKYVDEFQVPNRLSVAVLSNREALYLEQTDRRWAVLDISEVRRGDVKYFEQLADSMTEEVGCEFWQYLLSIDLTGHNDRTPPATKARVEKKIDSMPAFYKWMKDEFLMPKKDYTTNEMPTTGTGISKIAMSDFYEHYKESAPRYGSNTVTMIAVSKLLSSIGIHTKSMRCPFHEHPRKGLYVSYDALYGIFDKQGWIHSVDELPAHSRKALTPVVEVPVRAVGRPDAAGYTEDNVAVADPLTDEEMDAFIAGEY